MTREFVDAELTGQVVYAHNVLLKNKSIKMCGNLELLNIKQHCNMTCMSQ